MYNTTPICATCGTNRNHDITGYCINDHDDWLESQDEGAAFVRASKNLNAPIDVIIAAIVSGTEILLTTTPNTMYSNTNTDLTPPMHVAQVQPSALNLLTDLDNDPDAEPDVYEDRGRKSDNMEDDDI